MESDRLVFEDVLDELRKLVEAMEIKPIDFSVQHREVIQTWVEDLSMDWMKEGFVGKPASYEIQRWIYLKKLYNPKINCSGNRYWLEKPHDFYSEFNETEFLDHMKISKECCRLLLAEIQQMESYKNSTVYPQLSDMQKVTFTVLYLSAGVRFDLLSLMCNVEYNMIRRTVNLVRNCIAKLHVKWILRPTSQRQMERLEAGFYKLKGLPRCIGVIDGTLINITKPSFKDLRGKSTQIIFSDRHILG